MGAGTKTLTEIESQPRQWGEALRQFEQQVDELKRLWSGTGFDEIILTGCGSTYYAGVLSAALLQAGMGVTARAVSAAELMLFPDTIISPCRTMLLVCISRSGTTRETVAAAQMFRNHGGHSIVVMTCNSESPLAQTADVLVAIDAAKEESRVQTRSFSSMVVAITALAALLSGRDWRVLSKLPERLVRLTQASADTVDRLGGNLSITQFVFLGSGALYGLACEAMLKMTEMAKLFSVACQTLEYLHGPHYAADSHTQLIALMSESARDEERRVLDTLSQRGIPLLTLAESNVTPPIEGEVIALESGIPEWGRAILYLPPLQRICWLQAVKRGFDPDNLSYVPNRPRG